jgi:hypothetical protein
MNRIKLLIIVFLFFSGCQTISKQKNGEIQVTNELLSSIIHRYISFVSNKGDHERTISIICKKSLDSITFAIVNSYPDLSLVKFNGYMNLNGYRICLVGDYPSTSFFKIENNIDNNIPEDIFKRNKEAQSKSGLILANTEPILWTFYFKNSVLVRFSPEEEILTNCLECRKI